MQSPYKILHISSVKILKMPIYEFSTFKILEEKKPLE